MSYIVNGLQLYLDAKDYPNNSISNIWSDKSGIGNNATLNNFAFNGTTSGWTGKSLTFDGTDDVTTINNNSKLQTNQFTVELYINRYKAQSINSAWIPLISQLLYNNNTGWFVYYSQNLGGFRFVTGKNELSTVVKTWNVGSYIHFVVTYNDGVVSIYLDGALAFTSDRGNYVNFANVPIVLGARNANTGTGYTDYSYLEYKLVREYNRVLTADEITQNYQDATTIQSETVNILSVTINPNPVYVGNAFMISVEAV